MSTTEVQYTNNIFAFRGRIGRISYIIQNCIVNIIGFKFIYYPAIVETFQHMQADPSTAQLLNMLRDKPLYGPILHELSLADSKETLTSIIIKFLFLIPLRMIDIKRVRDIAGKEISAFQTAAVAICFSIPYVDFISTIFLSIMKPNKYAPSEFDKVAVHDKKAAIQEDFQAKNKRLFEEGKISQAEYIINRDRKHD